MLLTAIIMFQSMSVFVWVGILSSLFSMASDDDVYLHGWGGADLYMVSGSLMAGIMASNYTIFGFTLAIFLNFCC